MFCVDTTRRALKLFLLCRVCSGSLFVFDLFTHHTGGTTPRIAGEGGAHTMQHAVCGFLLLLFWRRTDNSSRFCFIQERWRHAGNEERLLCKTFGSCNNFHKMHFFTKTVENRSGRELQMNTEYNAKVIGAQRVSVWTDIGVHLLWSLAPQDVTAGVSRLGREEEARREEGKSGRWPAKKANTPSD